MRNVPWKIYGHRACTNAFSEFIRYLNLCNQYLLNVKYCDFGVVLWQTVKSVWGTVATATAMALRVNALSRWIMWGLLAYLKISGR